MVKVCLLFAFTVRRVVVDDMIYEFTMSKPKVFANLTNINIFTNQNAGINSVSLWKDYGITLSLSETTTLFTSSSYYYYYYYYAAVKTICMLYSKRNTGRQGVTCAPASETRIKR